MWPSVSKIVEDRYLGSAYALVFWIQNIGLMFIPWLVGVVLKAVNPGVAEKIQAGDTSVTYDYTVPMLIFAALGGVSLLHVKFDLNPLHLENQKTESVVWELRLLKESRYSSSYGTMVACSLEELPHKVAGLKQKPTISHVESVLSFLPEEVPVKRGLIQELAPVLSQVRFESVPTAAPQVQELAENWAAIATLLWLIGYIGLYFLRLPAYQHGRYIIHAFPILYLWGMLGLVEYVTSPNANKRIALLWTSRTGMLCLLFTIVAAQQNAANVAWIEKDMVGIAQWIQENLPSDALLAVHDIGAIGYFDQHRIIDLAGLVSPEVVPFIRDQARIATYLDQRGANYLVTILGFYPELVSQRELVYPAGGYCIPASDVATMCVFRWK